MTLPSAALERKALGLLDLGIGYATTGAVITLKISGEMTPDVSSQRKNAKTMMRTITDVAMATISSVSILKRDFIFDLVVVEVRSTR